MKKFYLYMLALLLNSTAFGQGTVIRGLYIDHFDDVLGNTVKEDSLLDYAQDSSFNYFALYDLSSFNLNNTNTANTLAAFIKKARENYGVIYVGAVVENYNSIRDEVAPYNSNRSDDHERFNVFNLEFEFWTTSSVSPGGYYCTQYLQPNNCSCDSAGGFKFFMEQISKIDSIAAVQQVMSETYLGWFNQGQGSQIQQHVDRVLLHAYRTNTSSLFSYSKTRMSYLASNNTMVDIAPIFSSEPNFMGPWLDGHSQFEAIDQYQDDYDNDNSAWKQYVNLVGFQWFDWKYMPKPVPGSTGNFNPVITSSAATTICSGDTIELTATHGNSYLWSTGATIQSITTSTSASYTCDVTLSGNTITTPAVSVLVKNNPTATTAAGNLNSGIVTITSSATAGSGTISSYQWRINSGNINGAHSASYDATSSGNYSVCVTNSYGCSFVSVPESIVIPGTCTTSLPSALHSNIDNALGVYLNWESGLSGDSLVIRYHVDTSSTYDYISLVNTGQTTYHLSNLLPGTLYSWRLKTVCGSTSSAYSNKDYFTTLGTVGLQTVAGSTIIKKMVLFPNPASENINVNINMDENANGELIMTDINGRSVMKEKLTLSAGENIFRYLLPDLKSGIYFMNVKTDENIISEKVFITN